MTSVMMSVSSSAAGGGGGGGSSSQVRVETSLSQASSVAATASSPPAACDVSHQRVQPTATDRSALECLDNSRQVCYVCYDTASTVFPCFVS